LPPQVLYDRSFITAAAASFLSFFAMVGIVASSPIFVQDVMQIRPTISGSMQTLYTMVLAFMGIPAGFLLAKTGKYK
jgi:hypothetical protein